jgi:hypothetical protein
MQTRSVAARRVRIPVGQFVAANLGRCIDDRCPGRLGTEAVGRLEAHKCRRRLYQPHWPDELTRSIAILKISRGVRRW